jgi:hypothetical protein
MTSGLQIHNATVVEACSLLSMSVSFLGSTMSKYLADSFLATTSAVITPPRGIPNTVILSSCSFSFSFLLRYALAALF